MGMFWNVQGIVISACAVGPADLKGLLPPPQERTARRS